MYGRGPQLRIGPAHTPNVIKALLAANVAAFLLQRWDPILYWGVLDADSFWNHAQLWRVASYMWLHAGTWHLLGNMFGLWMFGSDVAARWGTERFLRFYLISGIGAGVVIACWQGAMALLGWGGGAVTLGASGAVYAVLLASSLLDPDRVIYLLFPPIPLRAIYFIPFLFVMDLINAPPNVSHVGHLGGVLVGLAQLWWSPDAGVGLAQLRYRFRRWRMRGKLRALDSESERRRRTH